MMGVLVGHVLSSLYHSQIHSQDWSLRNQGMVLLLNVCAVSVNCFVMISGYFSIKLSPNRVLRYVAMCLWYALIIMLCTGGSWTQLACLGGKSEYWFIPCYLALMLIAPFLNQAILVSKSIFLLLFVDVVLGYWFQNASISVDGYNLFHLSVMYCLGRSIALNYWRLEYAGWWSIACFVCMTLLHAVKMFWNSVAVIYSLHYNAPMLICASVFVFLWIKGLSIQSRWINWVASSVFAVYLVLSNPAVAPYLQQSLWEIHNIYESTFLTFLTLSLFILGLFLACVFVDKFRVWAFNRIANFF